MSWSSTATSATSLGYLSTGTNDIGNITVVVNSSSETEAGTKTKLETKKTPEGISPKLYFSYVKSKLSTLEKKKLQERLKKLQGLVVQLKRLQEDKSHWDELTVSHGPIPLYLILRVNDEIAALKNLLKLYLDLLGFL